MHSYSLGITASWFVIIALICAATAFAVWSYIRTVPPVSLTRRITLATLRTLAVSLLLFALFEPILTLVSDSIDRPEFAVLLDNSQSMTINSGGRSRREEFGTAVKNSLNDADQPLLTVSFDSDAKSVASPDSLDFTGSSTDMALPLEWLRNETEDRNIRAALLITDGAFNTGNNPLYAADEFGRPIYVIGIGDSSEPKDITIQSLITNEYGSLDAELPVNVSLKSVGYDGEEVKVILSDNGAKVGEQTVKLRTGQQSYPLMFAYKPTAEGIRKLTASVAPAAGELTSKNNSAAEYVRISKQKRLTALFAGAPSPDVTFLAEAASEDKNTTLQMFVQKQGAEFYGTLPTAQQLAAAELIIFVGFPIASTPQSVLNDIKRELERGKPLLFIASQQTDYAKLKQFDAFMPFSVVSSRSQEYSAFADVKPQALGNVTMKINGTDADREVWNQLPPIFRTETFARMKPEAEMLASVKVNGVELAEPLISMRDFQQSKTLAILGYGLYRWKLLGFAAEQAKGNSAPDVFSAFFGNALRWLQVDESRKQVRIKTTKKFYGTTEAAEFTAQVYDRALVPADNAEVRVSISGNGLKKREIMLQALGNGRYSGQLDGLPAGDYSFAGTAAVNKQMYGSDNGRFSVSGAGLEFQNLRMNVELLRALAVRTGGKFYTPETAAQFLKDLKNNASFTPQTITRRSEIPLWSAPWLLGAALFCFALEWFLRKRSGMI
ncbi:hypothetical protein MASR2M18_11580 [Ignavibacteria bacterium]|nr:VWA domain-containing protein [Bacteroidota bacterium]